MKYIITGHKGLIGQHLKDRLDRKGNECVAAWDKRQGNDVNYVNYMKNIKSDMFLHFGAYCKINQTVENPILSFEDNVKGVFNVLEYCRKNDINKVMFASSSRILSTEENPYTASKKYGENLLEAYRQCYGMESIIIRPSTVYGPCYDETGRALHNFVVNAFRGDEIKIYGDKDKTLDFTYIEDFVDAIMLSMNQWNKAYNISGGERKVLEAAELVKKAVGSNSPINFYPQEIAQPQKVKVDTTEIMKQGFAPRYRLEDGIEKMVEWYKDNPGAWKNYNVNQVRIFNGKLV